MKKIRKFIYVSLFIYSLFLGYKNRKTILKMIKNRSNLLSTFSRHNIEDSSCLKWKSEYSTKKVSNSYSTNYLITEILKYINKLKNKFLVSYPVVVKKLNNIDILKNVFELNNIDSNIADNTEVKETKNVSDSNTTLGSLENKKQQNFTSNNSDYNTNNEEILLDLNERQIQILNFIRNFDKVTMLNISNKFTDVSERTLRRDMDKLELTGFVIQFGKTRDSYYVVVKK